MCISEEICRDWKLRDISALSVQENRKVYAAQSELYGPVVLKWNREEAQLRREYQTLQAMNDPLCRVYALKNGYLMEARILPGTSLREEKDLHARLERLASVWKRIHRPAQEGITYLNWVESAAVIPELPERLRNMGEQAVVICRELFRKYPERCLLHGDLHHDNILLREDGSYGVIDPKGVVGPRILDLPRFLLNEPGELVWPGIRWLSLNLAYPEADLFRAWYMEAVLANLWQAEDGLPLREDILDLAERWMEEFNGNQESR